MTDCFVGQLLKVFLRRSRSTKQSESLLGEHWRTLRAKTGSEDDVEDLLRSCLGFVDEQTHNDILTRQNALFAGGIMFFGSIPWGHRLSLPSRASAHGGVHVPIIIVSRSGYYTEDSPELCNIESRLTANFGSIATAC